MPWPESQFLGLTDSLPEVDKMRAKRFVNWQDRQAFVLGRMLLNFLFGKINLDHDVSQLCFTGLGKPFLENGPSFNLSHSGAYVVGALSTIGTLGVDIEECLPGTDPELFEFICCENEWSFAKSKDLDLNLFYHIWTRKEALIKALGKGLSVPLQELDVLKEEVFMEDKKWYLKGISIDQHYACHMALDAPIFVSYNYESLTIDDLKGHNI